MQTQELSDAFGVGTRSFEGTGTWNGGTRHMVTYANQAGGQMDWSKMKEGSNMSVKTLALAQTTRY